MREILEKLINEEIDIKTAENLIKSKNIMEFDEIAKFDSNRQNRTGFPEAVFAPSKDYDDLLLICKKYIESETSQNLIITKLDNETYEKLMFDLYFSDLTFDYNKKGQVLVIRVNDKKTEPLAKIGIITAGTSDIQPDYPFRQLVIQGIFGMLLMLPMVVRERWWQDEQD